MRSPLRSSSALVATVVPIFTVPISPAGIGFAAAQPEQIPDALHGGIPIGVGIFRQQLVGEEAPVRPAADDVGEGPAAVDPEIPARRRRGHVRLVPRPYHASRRGLKSQAAGKIGGGPAAFPPGPLSRHQPACKPGSVGRAAQTARVTAIPLGRQLPGASSNLPGRPDPDIDPGDVPLARKRLRAVPIRSCSRWGLPCRLRCRRRGALLPHRFTLAAPPA